MISLFGFQSKYSYSIRFFLALHLFFSPVLGRLLRQALPVESFYPETHCSLPLAERYGHGHAFALMGLAAGCLYHPPSIAEEGIARLGENPAQPTSTSARLSGADYSPCSGNLQAFVTAGETINNSIHITESHLGAEG
jgi:hypothetical protein